MTAPDIVATLLGEQSNLSESDEYLKSQFPYGLEVLIRRTLDGVIDYLLFEVDGIYNKYTSRLIRSVYWPNIVSAYFESHRLREQKRDHRAIFSAADCAERVSHIFDLLSQSVDLTDPSMKLPLGISSAVFSRLSVLLSIPLERDDLLPLSAFLMDSPIVQSLETWAEKLNSGCRLWSGGVINWRRKFRHISSDDLPADSSPSTPWWTWLGWSADKPFQEPPTEPTGFVADKNHNVLFAMVSVGAIFVYLGIMTSRNE
jgi:hypothetical protein